MAILAIFDKLDIKSEFGRVEEKTFFLENKAIARYFN